MRLKNNVPLGFLTFFLSIHIGTVTPRKTNDVSSWTVGSVISVMLSLVIVVVFTVRRKCFYRVVTDETLENNKILVSDQW